MRPGARRPQDAAGAPARALLGAYGIFIATQNAAWIAMLVYAWSRGGAAAAGGIAVAQLLPAALVAPVAAGLADRWSARGVLIGSYAVQIAGMLVAAVGIAVSAVAVGYAGAVLASVAVAATRPAQTVLLPALARTAAELTARNVALGWLESAAAVLSSLGTALLLAASGPAAVFAVAGLAGIASLVLALGLPAVPRAPREDTGRVRSVLAGAAVLARQPVPRLLAGLLSAQWAVIGALDLLFVVLAVDVLGRGDSWVGWLNTAYGAGGVVAGVAGAALLRRRRLAPVVVGATGASAIALALAAATTVPQGTLVLLVVVGAGRMLLGVATRSLLQRAVPVEVLGRVFGTVEALAMTALAVGSLGVPLLVAAGGAPLAVVGTAAVLPLVALLGGRRLVALDGAADVPVVEVALLRGLEALRPLPPAAAETLARSARWLELPDGGVLVREGEPGDCCYAVVDGCFEVTVGGIPAGTVGRGQSIGEIALLHDVPRTATVVAAGPAVVLALDGSAFRTAVHASPATADAAAAVALARLAADARRRAGSPPSSPLSGPLRDRPGG